MKEEKKDLKIERKGCDENSQWNRMMTANRKCIGMCERERRKRELFALKTNNSIELVECTVCPFSVYLYD